MPRPGLGLIHKTDRNGFYRAVRFIGAALVALGFYFGSPPIKAGAEDLPMGENEFGPTLKIRGFADANFIAEEDLKGFRERPNTFSLGQFDLFITSELGPKTSFLAEVVFFRGFEGNHGSMHLERAEWEYSHSSLLRLKLGRMHSAVSYWNKEYLHGRWFHTSVFRPKFYGWENHDRGVLPNHMLGIVLHGKKEASGLDLTYELGLVNGRGRKLSDTQDYQDFNDSKGVNGHLRLSSNRLPGLMIGFNTYFDRIPEDDELPLDPERAGEIKETILGGYFVYKRGGIEIINEYTRILHDDNVSEKEFESFGYYLQFSVKKGNFQPYYRLEYSDLDDLDPFWTDLRPLFDDYTANTFGLRWDFNLWTAFKIEYRFNNYHKAENSNDFYMQTAITF